MLCRELFPPSPLITATLTDVADNIASPGLRMILVSGGADHNGKIFPKYSYACGDGMSDRAAGYEYCLHDCVTSACQQHETSEDRNKQFWVATYIQLMTFITDRFRAIGHGLVQAFGPLLTQCDQTSIGL